MSGIQWVWAFLDEPRASFEEALTYWSALTRTTASPRRGADDEFLTLLPRLGAPWLKMQATGSGRGIHLDLDVDIPRAAAERALALGARELATLGDDQVVILASPAGFVFCFTRYAAPPGAGSAHPEASASMSAQVRVGEPDLVDQVCLDIPDSAYAREVDFWASLTGWPPLPNTRAEFTALRRPDGIPIRLLLQRLGESAGPARAISTSPAPTATQPWHGIPPTAPPSSGTARDGPYCATRSGGPTASPTATRPWAASEARPRRLRCRG